MNPPVPGSVQLTPEQWGFVCALAEWPYAEIPIIVCLGNAENLLWTGSFRPVSQNPGGGNDWGPFSRNDKAWPEANPSRNFEPMYAARSALDVRRRAQIARPTTNGFWPWLYPSPGRTAESLGITAMAARIGSNPLLDERNPYWILKDARIPTDVLPIPPRGLYVTRVPLVALKLNNHGAYVGGADTGVPLGLNHGDLIGQLQRLLDAWGFWWKPGYYDRWYGPNVALGVRKAKQLLADLGAYDGPVDGTWDLNFAEHVDGMEHYVHLVKGR